MEKDKDVMFVNLESVHDPLILLRQWASIDTSLLLIIMWTVLVSSGMETRR